MQLETRARRWLEEEGIPLPDPFTVADVRDRIAQHYPGGVARFLRDAGVSPGEINRGRRARRQEIIATIPRCLTTGRLLPRA